MKVCVSLTLEDVDDLNFVVDVTKKDDVALIGGTSQSFTNFVPCSAHLAR